MTATRTVAVLGAGCLLGKQVIEVALRHGFHVRALARDTDGLTRDQRLSVLKQQHVDATKMQRVMAGCNAVINCVEPSLRKRASAKDDKCASVAEAIIAASPRLRIERLISVSHPSVVLKTDRRSNLQGMVAKFMWPLIHQKMHRDRMEEAELLQESALQWTLVRCPDVEEYPGCGPVQVETETLGGWRVSVRKLAQFLIHQIDSPSYLQQGVFVNSRPRRLNLNQFSPPKRRGRTQHD